MTLAVLLEDGPLLAVNKPAGLPTQSSHANVPSLEQAVREYLRETYDKPGNVYLGIPHRLDRPVSGVILFSRNSKGAARLAEQFEQREVRKIYWGVLRGHLPQPRGLLFDKLRKLPDEPRAEVVPDDSEAEDAKDAQLLYRVLSTFPEDENGPPRTLVEIELITGRMHQIRIQFGSRGFPVLGDTLYGDPSPDTAAGTEPIETILLHARSIELKHPVRYEPLKITAPLPDWWPSDVREFERDDSA